MLKKFKWRFVLITMSLVGVVTLVFFGAVGFMHQQNRQGEIDRALEQSLGERMGGPLFGWDFGAAQERHPERNTRVPVCSVTVLADGSVYVNDTSSFSLDQDEAEQLAQAVLSAGNTKGSLDVDGNGYFYQAKSSYTSTSIVFADKTSFTESIVGFYLFLSLMWLLLMAAVFAVTLFLSRLVTRPVKQAWETQQQFIADASHELKTPLTVIMADASILAANPGSTIADQRQWVDSISSEAERMQQLTEGMLALAQADAGVDASKLMNDLDFSELVETAALQFEAVAFERGLMIDSEVASGIHVKGDKVRLEGLLKTLLENACKYSERPGTVRVTLDTLKGNARLCVRNRGDTIPPQDLPHLFDRFYRSDKSRVREGETASFGLGLSIAKSTVEMHGGSIGAESDDGLTVFTAMLPLVK